MCTELAKKRDAREIAKELLSFWYKQWSGNVEHVTDEAADKCIHLIKTEWPAVVRLAHELHAATKEETFWVYTCQPVRATDSTEAMRKVRRETFGNIFVTSATDKKPHMVP